MVELLTKLALRLTSDEERQACAQAMIDMEEYGLPVVQLKDITRHSTSCPDAEEVTKQSTALILLSEEDRTR